ncbi:MAG: phosphoribosylformylglycinamidine synthase subunit PurL [Acidobacteriaceae bacterium]|jgi:phosphoribosylformylglycinamidine synthase
MPTRAEPDLATPAQAADPTQAPTPAHITPALLKTHSITPDEYARIEKLMGRTPSLTELGIFSVMWSEHCSYKSSRVHLKRLPTRGTRTTGPGSVVQGPGENAGIIDVGDGWACAFKIESHNHPSYIEPYQGAATGVGGILRDIFTMNARPLAVMDSLRFGPLAEDSCRLQVAGCELKTEAQASQPATDNLQPATDFARNRQTFSGVVAGIAGYGNCFGVPNLGGETRFEACYSGNPLVNAFALGLVRIDEIFYAKATGVGNPVIYVGAKTGRDGIHGATMASEEFTEGSEQKRPNVQMGDPFMEKLLLEACLEAMATGAVLGIQDMGAAGLTCSTCEMGARGELGVSIELDNVPQRAEGMTAYEIMLSESQERMLLVADKGREGEVLAVFAKWGLDASIVGVVTADDVMRVRHHGELVAEIPNKALTDDAPVYKRPVGEWKCPAPLDPPAWVLEELKKPRDYTADLKKLLASANICDKRWVFDQYDSMVQTNTVQGPGGEAGVMRIKNSCELQVAGCELKTAAPRSQPATDNLQPATKPQRGLAMALAGNGRWCWLDPKLGAMHAVAEAARKVACTGATPVAATNCLNFGNPEKPEIMAQLSAAIDGIAEACTALGTPVTGGNVSLYNETKGEGIYPTPVIGIVGLLDDVSKAVPAAFQQAGDSILHWEPYRAAFSRELDRDDFQTPLGSSEFARVGFDETWGTPPGIKIQFDRLVNEVLAQLASERLLHSACDVGSGGIAVALAKACLTNGIGARADQCVDRRAGSVINLFGEFPCNLVLSCSPESVDRIQEIIRKAGLVKLNQIGATTSVPLLELSSEGADISVALNEVSSSFASTLESQLAAEVVTA